MTMKGILGNILGFVLLASASWWFLTGTNTDEMNFAVAIGYVLLIFAWTDYSRLIILTPFAFAAMLGFFLGNIDGIVYAAPTGLVFLLFAALMSSNHEKAATLTFVASLPVALVNSYYYPAASPVAWALVGLMVALIEHAAIEEMAEGDVFIIPLYFMVLGPMAFIPLAFQNFTGLTLYERKSENAYVYPVGPAMFVVSVPLFLMVGDLIESKSLPEWLFYSHFHGIEHPLLGIIGAFAGYFLIPMAVHGMEASEGNELNDETGRFTSAGAVMGLTAGIIGGLVSMAIMGLIGIYLDELGYKYLADVFVLLALGALFFGGFAAFALFSRLHYEGRSSIDPVLWVWGLNLVAALLSLFLLPTAWETFPDGRIPALATGLTLVFLFYLTLKKGENLTLINRLWVTTLLISAFLAGTWAGFNLWWMFYKSS